MKHIWKAAALMIAAFTVTACNNNKFTVEGQISNAKDSVLYFENVGLEGINILDSVKLGVGEEYDIGYLKTKLITATNYNSSTPFVASVDDNGLILAKKLVLRS